MAGMESVERSLWALVSVGAAVSVAIAAVCSLFHWSQGGSVLGFLIGLFEIARRAELQREFRSLSRTSRTLLIAAIAAVCASLIALENSDQRRAWILETALLLVLLPLSLSLWKGIKPIGRRLAKR